MLRFAANLSFMYGEYAFPDRFAAAAGDGFTAVEYLFPYEYPAQQLTAWLQTHGLAQALFNAPPGNWAAGERGLASLPGRETEFRAAMHAALDYAQALNCRRVHVMAGLQPGSRSTFVSNLAWAAALAQPAGVELLIEPINARDMPGYFLNRQDESPRNCRRGRQPRAESADGSVSLPDCGRGREHEAAEIPGREKRRPPPDCECACTQRA